MKRNRAANQSQLFAESDAASIITEIQPLPDDPNRRRVKVDGKTAATLRGSDVEDLKLQVGRRWTAALAERVQMAVATDKARRDAMRLLGQRSRSRKDLIDRLIMRGHVSMVAERIADEAVRDGWLDEQAFAADVIRGVTSRRPAGRRLVEEKLRARGVDEGVVEHAAADAAAGQDDRVAAMTLARRRLGTMNSVSPPVALRRIAGLLSRRGFDEDTVQTTLEGLRLILGASEDDQ